MASRFLLQKFSDGMSRSTSLLRTHASASATAAQGTKYFSIFSCSLAEAKPIWTRTEMPSGTVNYVKPAFLNYVRGVKQTFSSSASNRHKFTMKAEMAAKQAEDAARKPEIPSHVIVSRDANITIASFAISCVCWIYILSHDDSTGSNKGSSCNCQCRCSKPIVKQD